MIISSTNWRANRLFGVSIACLMIVSPLVGIADSSLLQPIDIISTNDLSSDGFLSFIAYGDTRSSDET
ncbi:MAG: hypothetical protein ACXAEF_12940, partial [Candidatus Thorarchaeota archaeon]